MLPNTSLIMKIFKSRIYEGLCDIWWDCKTLLDREMMPHEPQLYELTRKFGYYKCPSKDTIKVHWIQIHPMKEKANNTTDCKVINNMLHFCIWFMDLDYQFWKIKWPNKIILYATKCIAMQVTKP